MDEAKPAVIRDWQSKAVRMTVGGLQVWTQPYGGQGDNGTTTAGVRKRCYTLYHLVCACPSP